MRHIGKFSTRLLTVMVAIVATIAFAVHFDDAPFKSFARSIVKQEISAESSSAKVKIDLPASFAINEAVNSAMSELVFWCKHGNLGRWPTTIFAGLVPPYRGPPSTII